MSFLAQSEKYDPALSDLFASSAGPVIAPQRTQPVRANGTSRATTRPANGATQSRSESEPSDSESESEAEADLNQRPRKRRRVNEDNEDLEASYLNRLAQEEENDLRKAKQSKRKGLDTSEDVDDSPSGTDSTTSSADEDLEADEEEPPPQHETISAKAEVGEAEKLRRTVFLGNVSVTAITSKQAKKTLMAHLQTVLNTKSNQKIESIRFRSTAFVSDAGPKKAAYAKKELMEETTKSTNAYVVMSNEAAATKITSRLNGSIVLDRHLRADYLGNPAKTDHRRCVFVGNLSFVDEATATEETEDGSIKRKKGKEPADVEEGLWRTFGKAGKVESVRVVRDKETRVSKGFAYVQFEDENGVERALLLNERKFPPMLPRPLRVMRAKKVQQKAINASSLRKGNGIRDRHSRANRVVGRERTGKEAVVFEGHRASSAAPGKSMKPKKRHASKPTTRSSRRGAAFKAAGKRK